MELWMLVFPLILGLWVFGRFYWRGKPEELSLGDKTIAWLFFGGPFLVNLYFKRPLTKRELVGWALFFVVLVAGVAFTKYTCLGLRRGEVCS